MGPEGRSTWRSFAPIYQALQASGRPFVIIGGQACNIWASLYLGSDKALKAYLPFTSIDLDIFVDSLETIKSVAEKVGRRASIGGPDNADVVLGGFNVDGAEGAPNVQFLRWSLGVETDDLLLTAARIELDGVKVRVIHPIFSLQGKVCCLHDLSQTNRQDEKHVKMAVCYSACFLHSAIEDGRIRNALDGFEHIFRMALSSPGLHAWLYYGIPIENAVPADAISADSDERIKRFAKERWPRLLATLDRKRKAYATRFPSRELARFPALGKLSHL